MTRLRRLHFVGAFLGAIAVLTIVRTFSGAVVVVAQTAAEAPVFERDMSWPKPLPNNWVLGSVSSVTVDSRDHVWIIHRPQTVRAEDLEGGRGQVAPPVLEFDPEGNVVQAWGGPGAGYSWMEAGPAYPAGGGAAEHGIFVDHKDNVWVTGNGHVALKFTRAGKFLLQIGELWKTGGSNHRRWLGSPTDLAVDPNTNEVFISDGYLNRRVIVFDAETGAYQRHWGAYGNAPEDGPAMMFEPDRPLPRQFLAAHCVRISNDRLVYVCDRQRNRVQVFRTDGTFVTEVVIAKATPAGRAVGGEGNGSVWRVGFSSDPEQRYLYVADSQTPKMWILTRSDLQVVGSFDTRGLHHLGGADSTGHLYTTGSRRPERLLLKGVAAATTSRP